MFSGLRQNSIIYVLEKKQGDGERLSLRIGQVLSVSNPQPKYQPNYQLGAQGMETTVDITVKIQDEQMEFKQLPSTAQIAKEREQAEKITKLESKVSGMEDTLSDIEGMLSKALSVKSANK